MTENEYTDNPKKNRRDVALEHLVEAKALADTQGSVGAMRLLEEMGIYITAGVSPTQAAGAAMYSLGLNSVTSSDDQ